MSSSLTAIRALVRRDFAITRSYRLSFALEAVYGVLGLVLYYFISRTFADVSSSDLGNAPSYFDFAAVGLVVGTVIVATTSSVGYRVREEQTTGTLEALAATPVSSIELSIGLVGFPFLFAAVQATFYLAVASIFLGLDVSNASWAGVVAVLLFAGLALAPIGVLAGAAVLVFKRGQLIAGAIVYLMTLLGGMLFPISVLPSWVQPLADVLPLRYALNGARDALFTGGGWETDATVLFVWALILWPVALVVFERSGAYARRAGSMSEY
jgi:ABC-2 type transport system permease protein